MSGSWYAYSFFFFGPPTDEFTFRNHEIKQERHSPFFRVEPAFTAHIVTFPDLSLLESSRNHLHKARSIPEKCG